MGYHYISTRLRVTLITGYYDIGTRSRATPTNGLSSKRYKVEGNNPHEWDIMKQASR